MNKKGEQIDLVPEKVGEDVEIRMFDTESDLLLGFNEIINEINPQIICGYNIFGFDLPYIYNRSKLNAITSMFDQLSFIKGLHSKEVKIEWSSSAFKNQNFTYLDAPGRLWIDMLPIIQRDYKLENYKLKTVSDYFLGSTKDPLTVKGIFKCYRMFTPESLSIVAKYCVKDSELVVKLFEKLQIWIGLVEMSNTCNTPIFTLFTQGQQIKIFSQVYKKCLEDNIVIDKDSFIVNENDHFTGAYVFTPVPGLYDMVVSFDFSSLYPSTIIAYNIDYSTLVLDEKIPDEKCHIFEWEDHFNCSCPESKIVKTKKIVICKKNRFRFLKEPMGVIPTLLTNLIDARKKAKKEMEKLQRSLDDMKDEKEKEETERMITVFDKRQLAFKVSCNSVSSNTPIPCIDEDGKFMYLTMEEISDGVWISDDEKNQVSKPKKGLSVWTEKGYTKINYVIRHPIRTPLKRVITHTGCVDVTEEHSLLDENANEVRTIDLSIGDKLLHHSLPLPSDTPNKPMFHTIHKETIEQFDLKENINYEKAFLWGLFFAEGTSGNWGILEKAKSSWIIYNLDKNLLNRAKEIVEKVENMTFMVSDLYKNSGAGIHHLKPVKNKEGSIVELCKKYRKLFYDQRGYKRIPSEIFQADFYTRQSFLMGYYAGDGSRFLEKGVVMHNKGEIGTAGLCYLAKSLGYIVSISYNPKKDSIYRLQCCTSFRYKNTTSIKSILPSTPVPEIKKLQPDIIRNDTKIFFNEEGVVMYRGVRINCERIPRQKLLDAIDRLIDVMKIRKCSILEYYTDSKKIKYQTWCCKKQDVTGVKGVYIENTTYLRICECNKAELKDDEYNKYNNYISFQEDKTIEYIYDIETENHHFAAGVGDLIVHNSMYGGMGVKRGYLPFLPGAMCTTARGRQSIEKASKFLVENYGAKLIYGDTDSCYISFPQFTNEKDAKDLDSFCRKVEEETSSLFPRPMKFAYEEAIYWRYLILSKKRYMALKCDVNGKVKDKIEKRGVLLSRRDNSAFSRDFYSKLIMKTFYKENFDPILDIINSEIGRLCYPVLSDEKNRISDKSLLAKDLSISKSIGDIKDYKIKPLPEDGLLCNKCLKCPEKLCKECTRINMYKDKKCNKCKDKKAVLNFKTPLAAPLYCYRCKEDGMVDVWNKKLIKRLSELKIYDEDADLEMVKIIFKDFIEKNEEEIDDHKINNQLEYQIVSEYINRSLPSQMQLAQKMRRRGTFVAAGERISYVVIESENMKDKLFDKIEDLEYYKENINYMNIDQLYYMKLMINPIDEVIRAVYQKDVLCKIYKYRENYKKVINHLNHLFTPRIHFDYSDYSEE
jgi:DNA polymerase elongation subunit (family B)